MANILQNPRILKSSIAVFRVMLSVFVCVNGTGALAQTADTDTASERANITTQGSVSNSYFELLTDADQVQGSQMLPPLLQGFAKQDPTDLRPSGKFLFGGLEDKRSPMTAIQRRGRSRFHADLFSATPLFSPVASKKLEGQIDRVRPNLFDLVADKRKPLSGDVYVSRPKDSQEFEQRRPTFDRDVSQARPSNLALVPLKPEVGEPQIRRQPPPELDVTQPTPAAPPMMATRPISDIPATPHAPGRDEVESPRPWSEQPEGGGRGGTHHSKIPKQFSGSGGGFKIKTPHLDFDFDIPSRPGAVPMHRPDVGVETLSAPRTDNGRVLTKPRDDDALVASRRTDIAYIAKPNLDTEIVAHKKKSESEVSRHAPNVEVIFSKPTYEDSTTPAVDSKRPIYETTTMSTPDPKPAPEADTSSDVELRKPKKERQLTPQIPKGQAAKQQVLKDADSAISWDRWYAALSHLCEPLLSDALEKHGNAAGANSIQITVWRDHRLTAKLANGQRTEFDEATLEAYRSVNGNAALEFPEGSRRQKVSFYVDNKHDTNDAVSGVNSRSITGDRETPGRD